MAQVSKQFTFLVLSHRSIANTPTPLKIYIYEKSYITHYRDELAKIFRGFQSQKGVKIGGNANLVPEERRHRGATDDCGRLGLSNVLEHNTCFMVSLKSLEPERNLEVLES